MKYLVAMKYALALLGWLAIVGGFCLFLGAALSNDLDNGTNAALVVPAATFVLAGAVLLLASVVAAHAELRADRAPQPPFPGQPY